MQLDPSDILGKKVGEWNVLECVGKKGIRWNYIVVCSCGFKKELDRSAILSGKSTRCRSCARKISTKGDRNAAHKHGYSSTSHPYFRVYTAWCTMKSRCYREKDKNYARYGAKGISVCERWLESFENFLDDMGHPASGHSLDRIDVYGNYCKENCRWANDDTQNNNCRRTIYHEYAGEKLSETQWSRKLGISRNKVMWWARKKGIKWVVENVENLKNSRRGMNDDEYKALGLPLPKKLWRD